MTRQCFFVTGATGLVGRELVRRLITHESVARVYVLTRRAVAGHGQIVLPVYGDLHLDGCGLAPEERARLAREVTTVVHLAANTEFSQSLDDARAINCDGTRRLLELSASWPGVSRWVYVSTAFVAGLRTGVISEDCAETPVDGWANAYEQSKFEAEEMVRSARSDWAIARPATIVCDDSAGAISQQNAVHRALRLYFGGLAAMLPGNNASVVDVVTNAYVARGVVRVALTPDIEQRVFHLCAGDGAMPLDELLDVSHGAFVRAPAWRRKGIARPVRTDLATYRLFERAAHDAGSDRVRKALTALSHFVPHLAYPKRFDTSAADALLGERAPSVASFWTNMTDHLVGNVASLKGEGEAA
jgi:nucleoside-diphosphate-sugar epimerase